MILWKTYLLALVSYTSGFNILCYYTNWAQYRSDKGKFTPEHVDPNLCTHISYAFCKIVGMDLATYEFNDLEMYPKIIALKSINPKLKILLVVGGGTMGHGPFIEVSRNEGNRNAFAQNVIRYVRRYNFDGFEIDWEFPGAGEKDQFALLIKKLRESFDEEAKTSGKERLQLGVAASAGKVNIDAGLDVPNVARYVDFLNVMTYDYYGSWSSTTGFSSALYAHPNQPGDLKFLNLNWSAKYVESKGAPREKLNVGLGTYGRSFTLRNPNVYDVLSPFKAAGAMLPYSKTAGIAFYYEICDVMKAGGKLYRSDVQGNPYVVKGDQWYGFDDPTSFLLKARYVKDNNYAGVIIWTMDDDDFNGASCDLGKYPLLSALVKVIPPGSNNNNNGNADVDDDYDINDGGDCPTQRPMSRASHNVQNLTVGIFMLLAILLAK